jgi:aspartate kinase
MIIQSGSRDMRQDISFTCGRDERNKVDRLLKAMTRNLPAENYALVDTIAKVSVVGAGMISHPGVAATMFRVLAENHINIDMISTSEIKISCIVDEVQVNDAVLALHTAFGLDCEEA